METLALAAAVAVVYLVCLFVHAYAIVRALRALDLGGPYATLERALVVVFGLLPVSGFVGWGVSKAGDWFGIAVLAQVGICLAIRFVIDVVVSCIFFDLEAVDGVVAIGVAYLGLIALGFASSLVIGFVLAVPQVGVPVVVGCALAGWVTRARRASIERRLRAALNEA